MISKGVLPDDPHKNLVTISLSDSYIQRFLTIESEKMFLIQTLNLQNFSVIVQQVFQMAYNCMSVCCMYHPKERGNMFIQTKQVSILSRTLSQVFNNSVCRHFRSLLFLYQNIVHILEICIHGHTIYPLLPSIFKGYAADWIIIITCSLTSICALYLFHPLQGYERIPTMNICSFVGVFDNMTVFPCKSKFLRKIHYTIRMFNLT